MECTVSSPLQRAVSSSIPYAPTALTPAALMLCQEIASSIGEEDITAEVVGKVIAALRNAIVQDLRGAGVLVLDGLVRFKRSEAKARPAEYAYNALHGKVILHKATGPQQRVHGRVPRPTQCTETPVQNNLGPILSLCSVPPSWYWLSYRMCS